MVMAFKLLWAALLPTLVTLASARTTGTAIYQPLTTVKGAGPPPPPRPTSSSQVTASTNATATVATPSVSITSAATSTVTALARRADVTTAVAPSASAYALNSTFSINSDAVTRTYDWTIATATGSPDGFSRNHITINGQMPGPLIEANEGDTLVVNVQNNMDDTTSIHWHGILQNGTAWMDGVPGVTQCPIPAGGNFTYTFTLAQYGTYWYHSHSAVEYTDGLLGPLIIHSVNDPLVRGTDFDYEQVLIVQDWYHDEASTIAADLLNGGYNGSPAAPPPQSGLINGRGVFNCSQLTDTSSCTTPSVPEYTVEPNAKTRFRLINGGSHAQFYFSVDSHTVNVTEADGTPVSGADSVHRLPFHNGQRYSGIIDTTVGSAGDAYWLRATMNTDCFAYTDDTLNTTAFAILRYGSTSTSDPTSSDWTDVLPDACVDLDDDQLSPIVVKDAPATSDKTIAFDSSFGAVEISGTDYLRFLVNDTSYTNYIYQPIMEAVTANGTSAVNASNVANAVFEDSVWTGDVIINNLDANLDHPYHVHGNDFQIVGRGTGTLSIADAASQSYNLTNPVRRDTVVIPGGGYAVLRFANDNPGVWVLHCHIAWHLAEGFLGLIVSNPTSIAAFDYPDSLTELCDARPSTVSIDATEAGRKRSEGDSLAKVVKRGIMGHSHWSKKRMIRHRR